MSKYASLYENRKLSAGYPELEARGVHVHSHNQDAAGSNALYIGAFMECMKRLITVEGKVLLVGCGPHPHALKWLCENGYDAEAIEPVEMSVKLAAEFGPVRQGSAENIPFADQSCRAIFMESVLEHVDSPEKSLAECFRVLEPGGALFIYTTNRWKFNIRGFNGEYNIPFFNWLPKFIQESFVFHTLHFRPDFANHNARPAVHWFSYPELCQLGRSAGFAQFYSTLDLADAGNKMIQESRLRGFLLDKVRYNPVLRALALTQMGGTSIYMWKRP